jgi:hypothetical protein
MFPSKKSGEKPTQIRGITPRTRAPKTSTKENRQVSKGFYRWKDRLAISGKDSGSFAKR